MLIMRLVDLYERFVAMPDPGKYESWRTEEDIADTNTMGDRQPDLANHLTNLVLYEFIGVDSSTNLPIYIPVNKHSYVYKGQEFHESGVYSPNDLSAIPGNNLIHQVSKADRIAELNKQLAVEQADAKVVVYNTDSFKTQRYVRDRLSDAEEEKAMKRGARRKTNSIIENINITENTTKLLQHDYLAVVENSNIDAKVEEVIIR